MNPAPSATVRLLRHLSCVVLLLFAAQTALAADILYIKPSLEVLMRKGRADNARIIATIPMGTAVELVQGGKDWSHIRLQDGTQGWVRSRFLGSSPIIPMANIRPGIDADGKVNDIQGKFVDLAGENGQLRKELAACSADRSTLADKYQTLTGDPASPARARTELDEAKRQIGELQQQLTAAQIECTVLKKNESIKWFFTGSVVLLLGWLIGRVGKRAKKQSSTLLS